MSEPKKVPENLDEFKTTEDYIDTDDNFTVKELQSALDEMGVDYKSGENKDVLIWRFVDAQNESLENDLEEQEDTREETEAEVKQEEPKPEPKPKAEPKYEQLRIMNKGAYNLYEPHSRTLFYAHKVAVIELKPSINIDRLMSNIKQINATRGNVLVKV